MALLVLGMLLFAIGLAAFRTKASAVKESRQRGPAGQQSMAPTLHITLAYVLPIVGALLIVGGIADIT